MSKVNISLTALACGIGGLAMAIVNLKPANTGSFKKSEERIVELEEASRKLSAQNKSVQKNGTYPK